MRATGVGLVAVLVLLLTALVVPQQARADGAPVWVGSAGRPSSAISNAGDCNPCTTRSTVHLSVGGPKVRLTLSNALGTDPLTVAETDIALPVSYDSPDAVPGSRVAVTFGGSASVVIPAGQVVTSDAVAFPVEPDSDVLVSSYYSGNARLSYHHRGTRLNSWIWRGTDQAAVDHPVGATSGPKEAVWVVSGVDVAQDTDDGLSGTVVTLGDSITDGVGSPSGTDERWADQLADRLGDLPPGMRLGLVNAGISGNRVLLDGTGPAAVDRFQRDVLSVAGARTVLVLEGINDLRQFAVTDAPADVQAQAQTLIDALSALAGQAHANGMRAVGATILPFKGYKDYTTARDAVREAVNAWIRSTSTLDGFVDFDAAVRDPADPARMRPSLDSGDHLHPGPLGHTTMAQAVDLTTLGASPDASVDPRASLRDLTAEASLLRQGSYSAVSFEAVAPALAAARTALADQDASVSSLARSYAALHQAVRSLTLRQPGYGRYELEDAGGRSADVAAAVDGGTGRVVPDVAGDSWFSFHGVDLTSPPPATIAVSYASDAAAAARSRVEVRSGSATGTLVTTIDLPTTGSSSTYTTVTHELSVSEQAALSAAPADLTLVFRSDDPAARVAGVDYVTLAPSRTAAELESVMPSNGYLADGGLVAGTDYQDGDNGSGDVAQNMLKTEDDNGGRSLAGVTDGAWVLYRGFDLGSHPAGAIELTYDAPVQKVVDGEVLFYLDSMDGSPVATASLTSTGSSWGTYATTRVPIPEGVTGRHDVYVVFRSTPDSSHPYVGNFDSFAFVAGAAAPFPYEELTPNNVTELSEDPLLSRDGSAGSYRNFSGTHDGTWAEFDAVDLGPDGADTFTFSFDRPATKVAPGSRVEVRLDSLTGPVVVSTPLLPSTSSGGTWGTYLTTSVRVDPTVLTGTHDVFVVFRADQTNTSGAPYVGNFAWFQFGDSTEALMDRPTQRVEAESVRIGAGTLADAGLVAGTDYSGSTLATVSGGTMIGGTHDGSWMVYRHVDVGARIVTGLDVSYDAPTTRVVDGTLRFYLDSMDGDPVAVVPLPSTGDAWGSSWSLSSAVTSEFSGLHDVYVVFSATEDTAHPYSANLDGFDLVLGPSRAGLRSVLDTYAPVLDDPGLYAAQDVLTLRRAVAQAQGVLQSDGATSEALDRAVRDLRLAGEQMQWTAVRELDGLVRQAQAVDPATVTPASYAALQAAVAAAGQLDEGTSTVQDYQAAGAALDAAYEGLVSRVSSTTTLQDVPSSVALGTAVPVTVQVTSGATGQVDVLDGGALVSTTSLDTSSRASVSLQGLAAGTHELSARYSGDDTHLGSVSQPVTVTVTRPTGPTDPGGPSGPGALRATAPTLSRVSQVYGAKPAARAVLSTTVSGATGGTVTFRAGGTVLGTAPVRRAGSAFTATLRLGAHQHVGAYRGIVAVVVAQDGRSTTSSASRQTLTVRKARPKKVRLAVKRVVHGGTRARVVVRVGRLTNGARPAGKVVLSVGGHRATTVRLTAGKKGRVKVTVHVPAKVRSRSVVAFRARYVPKPKKASGIKAKRSAVKKVRLHG